MMCAKCSKIKIKIKIKNKKNILMNNIYTYVRLVLLCKVKKHVLE